MRMKLLCSSLSITVAGSLLLCIAGCEDETARQRDEAQVKLTQLRGDLRQAIAKGGDTPEAYQASLNKIVTALDGVGNGESGQQAAKGLLAAEALREIAAAHSAAAADIELAHASELSVADAQVDAALRLHSLANGFGSFDVNQMRDALQTQVQAAQQAAAALREQIAALEGPINQHTSQNQTQGQQIEQMRIQVGNLLKQAQDAGYADGLDTYLEAKQLDRQADKIEYEVSHREIDLDHDLSPQHRMALAQLAQVEAMIQALEAAQSEIEGFAATASGDAKTSRAKIDQLAGQVNQTLSAIKTESDGPLAAAYEGALSALQRAGANAAKAASAGGPGANAAKMMNAGIQEATARTHLSAARGLADRTAVLLKIKQAGGALPMNGIDAQINEIYAALQKHTAEAKAALDEASQTLEGAAGGSSEVEAFRANLTALSNALSGKAGGEPSSAEPGSTPPTPPPPADEEPTTPETGDAPATEPAGPDAPTPPAEAPEGASKSM